MSGKASALTSALAVAVLLVAFAPTASADIGGSVKYARTERSRTERSGLKQHERDRVGGKVRIERRMTEARTERSGYSHQSTSAHLARTRRMRGHSAALEASSEYGGGVEMVTVTGRARKKMRSAHRRARIVELEKLGRTEGLKAHQQQELVTLRRAEGLNDNGTVRQAPPNWFGQQLRGGHAGGHRTLPTNRR